MSHLEAGEQSSAVHVCRIPRAALSSAGSPQTYMFREVAHM